VSCWWNVMEIVQYVLFLALWDNHLFYCTLAKKETNRAPLGTYSSGEPMERVAVDIFGTMMFWIIRLGPPSLHPWRI
jgi:hypothetical protein